MTPLSAEREAIIVSARSLLGVPWVHEGRSREGLDCAGTTIFVGWDTGISTYDTRGYPEQPGPQFVRYWRDAGCVEVPLRMRRPADILLFRFDVYPCHCGILVSPTRIVHAYRPLGKVVEQTLSGRLERAMSHCFRFPGIED